MIAKPAYPYLCRDSNRHGRIRYRLRMPGRKAVTIKGQFGSAEFAENYRAAVEGDSPKQVRFAGKPGSFNRLGREYLHSAAFATLAAETRRTRRYCVEKFLDRFGGLSVANLERRHVQKIIDDCKPGQSRIVLSMLRALIALANRNGDREDDPTIGIKRPKINSEGWHTWTEEEIAQFEARHPAGSPARLAFALALYTGQRSADLIRMGRQHVRDNKINVAQQKTQTRLWIPLDPRLLEIIQATPSEHLTFIVSEHGKPFASAQSFGFRMRTWTREAGLSGCPLHGLRKACCRRLAEAGCTVHEIKAISGHKSIAEVERYTRAVDQNAMAERAIARTFTTHTAVPPYPQEKKA
jgi:integrase